MASITPGKTTSEIMVVGQGANIDAGYGNLGQILGASRRKVRDEIR